MNKKNLSLATSIFFLSSFLFLSVLVKAEIVINEIMYNPLTSGDYSGEWIELYNFGNGFINVSDWSLTDNSQTDTIECFNSTITNCSLIIPFGFAIISTSNTIIYQNFTIFDNVTKLKVDDTRIGNGLGSSDLIIIRNTTDLIDVINYTSFTFVTEGYTLERIDSFDANTSSNWKSSLALNGTPGYRNSVTPSEHDLAVYTENISFTPTDPSPRTAVNITVAINNIGIRNETDINVSIYNTSSSSSTFIDSRLLNISKQSSVNFTTVWNTTSKGNFTILVSIANVSNENLTNNNATKNITVDFHLVLNEIMYNPPGEIGSDADFEYIEIYNNATYSENLTSWKLECDSSSKTLTSSLNSGSYLVFAKDRTQFYTYYSSSILIDSESCSLNNDGDTIRLIFNDSGIYHEESVAYSNSWGADGTGYTLEKINPNANNAANNWAESKAYAGTPGTKNNPDTQIKPSLKQTEIVYRTSSSGSSGFSSSTPTQQTKENYEIISYQDTVSIGEEFTTIVKLQSDVRKTFSVYSYVFDGKKLLSEGYDGSEWQNGWSANEQEISIGPKPENVVLKNRIKITAPSGNYKLRVRIKGEKDLTKDIIVLPQLKFNQTVSSNQSSIVAMACKGNNGIIEVQIKGNGEMSLHIFSQDGFEIRNVTVEDETIEKIQANSYAYIQVVDDNFIKDKCYVEMEKEKPKSITGKTVLPETNNILEMIYQLFKVLFNSENN